jgi:hypothetical protein
MPVLDLLAAPAGARQCPLPAELAAVFHFHPVNFDNGLFRFVKHYFPFSVFGRNIALSGISGCLRRFKK